MHTSLFAYASINVAAKNGGCGGGGGEEGDLIIITTGSKSEVRWTYLINNNGFGSLPVVAERTSI